MDIVDLLIMKNFHESLHFGNMVQAIVLVC